MAITHANPRSLCEHPRNKTDEELRAVAAKGGVVGATIYPRFLRRGSDATIEDVVDVVEHLAGLIGVDHVAIGTDFTEGQPDDFFRWTHTGKLKSRLNMPLELPVINPLGIRSAAEFPNITARLLARGISPGDVKKIMGGNWLRLFRRGVGVIGPAGRPRRRPVIPCVETHTCGEPTRIVTMLDIPGSTIVEKQEFFRTHLDHVRRALMREPRGHRDMFGAVLTRPVTPEAAAGVIWLDHGGYLSGCGHATIGAGDRHGGDRDGDRRRSRHVLQPRLTERAPAAPGRRTRRDAPARPRSRTWRRSPWGWT